MNDQQITLDLKRFLLTEQCPEAWHGFDLYLFRDEEVVFYVGQSDQAHGRVWQHLLNGFKGRSDVGRFVWCNWPKSMRFTIELHCSQADTFAHVNHELDAAEQALIARWSPCFNVVYNKEPTPLPEKYAPPNAPLRCSRRLGKLIREAERAVEIEDRKLGTQKW
ncbi:MAG: GIY-YIG nuclease family protein [Anaerolineales bacterium]|nr:GIY-YIG nuclease family protein [Anaerolineales bacterium]